MSSLVDKFRRHSAALHLFPPGCSVLVAVSGGADSVSLLHLLALLAAQFRLRIVAAHLDHSLRPESAEDAAFVGGLCAALDVPLISSRVDVPALLASRRGGLEEVARDARRQFLLQAASLHGCELIALGHHLDDQAETFLLRLLRGAGPDGLAGMCASAPPFVRPLLPFTHAELVDWLTSQAIPWREDSSNRDESLLRNRVRHCLLPELESFNPRIRERLVTLSSLMADDERDWALRIRDSLPADYLTADGGYCIPCSFLAEASPAFAGRLAREILRRVRGDLRGISACHIASMLSLARSHRAQGDCHLPRAWIGRRYEALLVLRSPPEVTTQSEFLIPGPGDYRLADGRILQVRLQSVKEDRGGGDSCSCTVRSVFPLVVRAVLPGDRILLGDDGGHKKLQDLFVDLKISREQRAAAIVVADRKRVLWVVGLRRAGSRPPSPGEEPLTLTVVGGASGSAQKP